MCVHKHTRYKQKKLWQDTSQTIMNYGFNIGNQEGIRKYFEVK